MRILKKDFFRLGLTFFLFLILPVTLSAAIQMRYRYNLQSRAISKDTQEEIIEQTAPSLEPVTTTFPPRGTIGDLWADVVIGKPNFSEITPNTTVSHRVYLPHGVIIDRASSPNKMYIYDAGNNRILGFDWGRCLASTTNCSADIVIGQPSMSTSACNGDSGFQNYPNRAPASVSSLCGEGEATLSVSEGGSGASMAVDSQENLYVFDAFNNRVLKYVRPFETDTVADEVWGQDNFTENKPNKGMSSPDATSLRYGWGRCNAWTAGVDVDSNGNLWVADNGNNRVLRFPPGSKRADLIFGQVNVTSSDHLDVFSGPTVVRVSNRGWVYVADQCNNRVLVFKPPFSNGMKGSVFCSGFAPAGIDFDPTEPNRIWITDYGNRVIGLWDEDTQQLVREVGQRGNVHILGDATGSVGIDSAGNIVVAIGLGDCTDDVLLFKKGEVFDKPSKRLFGWGGNLKTGSGLGLAAGVAVVDNQLIVADLERIMFWNNPNSLYNGKSADGVSGYNMVTKKGVSSLTDPNDRAHGCCQALKADKNHHLWVSVDLVADTPFHIEMYQLPLTNGAEPIKTISKTLPVLGSGQVGLGFVSGLAPTDDSMFLWVSQVDSHRVFRIRDPLTNPVVDVILGQIDLNGVLPNRGGQYSATTLNSPGALSLDCFGNLYVSDHWLEIRGNKRLLVFNKNLFPKDNTEVIYAPAASKIFPFPYATTWEPSFDSQNRMVVGYNTYSAGWFPGVYNDPLSVSIMPDAFCNDFYSMAYSATFDDSDNLYIGDLNRSRVLIYKKPLPPISQCSELNYPFDKWQRVWYTYPGEICLGDGPDELSEGFDTNWGSGNEIAYGRVNRIKLQSSRTIHISKAGTYRFNIGSDDGVRFYLDDELKLERWFVRHYTVDTLDIYLSSGDHKLRLDYYENLGAARLSFEFDHNKATVSNVDTDTMIVAKVPSKEKAFITFDFYDNNRKEIVFVGDWAENCQSDNWCQTNPTTPDYDPTCEYKANCYPYTVFVSPGIISDYTGDLPADYEGYVIVQSHSGLDYPGGAPNGPCIEVESGPVAEMSKKYPQAFLAADLDCDCDVDIVDIMKVAAHWNTQEGDPNYNPMYDLDNDGDIDMGDINKVTALRGTKCSD